MEQLRPHAERKYRLPRNGHAAIAAIDFDHPIFIERAGELPTGETPRLFRLFFFFFEIRKIERDRDRT